MLCLYQDRVVTTEQRVDFLLGGKLFDQAARFGRVAAVVEDLQVDLHLFAANIETTRAVDLIGRKLIRLLEVTPRRTEGAGQRQDCANFELGRSGGGLRRCGGRRAPGQQQHKRGKNTNVSRDAHH